MLRYLTTALLVLLAPELSVSGRSVKSDEVIDLSKSVAVSSRIPCDGYTAPEDQVSAKASFSEGQSERSFTLSEFQKGGCKVDVKLRCLDRVKTGWRQAWAMTSTHSQITAALSLHSCYEWGSKDAAQYVISGWYKEGGVNRKAPWSQASVKQVSTNPDLYEFSDSSGGTAKLTLIRR